MTFEKGRSGNPGGRKRNTFMIDALLIEIKGRERDDDKAGMRRIAAKIVELAVSGDMRAIEFIRDTIDGKPATVLVGDDEGDPIRVVQRLERVIVDADKPE